MATLAVLAVGYVLVQVKGQTYPIRGDYKDWYGPPKDGWHLPGECNNWNADCRFKNLNDEACDDCERACNGEQICAEGDCQPNPAWCGDIDRTDCERRRDRCEDYCGEDKCIGMHDTLCADFYDDCVLLYNEQMLKVEPNYQYCVDKVIAQNIPYAWLKEECCNEIASSWVMTACVTVQLPNLCREACYPAKYKCDDPECDYCMYGDDDCAWPDPECDDACEACSDQCDRLFPLSSSSSSARAPPVGSSAKSQYDFPFPGSSAKSSFTDQDASPFQVVDAPISVGWYWVGGLIAAMLACIAGLLCFAVCIQPLVRTTQLTPNKYAQEV